jgi:hypothetical protein
MAQVIEHLPSPWFNLQYYRIRKKEKKRKEKKLLLLLKALTSTCTGKCSPHFASVSFALSHSFLVTLNSRNEKADKHFEDSNIYPGGQ